MNPAPRNSWPTALLTAPNHELLKLTSRLAEQWKIRPKSLTQSGLGMLKLEDGAFGEPYNLGEIPLSTAWLIVETESGDEVEGAAQIMSDEIELAEAIALCDAILSNKLKGWQQVAELVSKGLEKQQEIMRERKLMMKSTRVDFSLLDDAGENDD